MSLKTKVTRGHKRSGEVTRGHWRSASGMEWWARRGLTTPSMGPSAWRHRSVGIFQVFVSLPELETQVFWDSLQISPWQTMRLKSGVSGLLEYFNIVFQPDLSGWLAGLQVPVIYIILQLCCCHWWVLFHFPPNCFKNFPDFVNQPSFPDGILRPGQVTHKSLLRFGPFLKSIINIFCRSEIVWPFE